MVANPSLLMRSETSCQLAGEPTLKKNAESPANQ
jgi:hypothetical protein